MPSYAANYSADWKQWSQQNSDDYNMQKVGCWVVAQAKLLRQAGVVTDGTSKFNPDTYLSWQKTNGYINSGYYQTKGGYAPEAYANSVGGYLKLEKEMALTGTSADNTTILNLVKQGFHVIVMVNDGGHYLCVLNQESLDANTAILSESAYGLNTGFNITLNTPIYAGTQYETVYRGSYLWYYSACSHSFDGLGTCTKCGHVYDWQGTKASLEGTAILTHDNYAYKTTPYGDSDSATIGGNFSSSGTMLGLTARYQNAFDHTWYEISADNRYKYIYSDRMELLSSIEGHSYPISLSQGSAYTLTGLIRTDGVLNNVKAFVWSVDGGKEADSHTVYPQASTCDVGQSIDRYIDFDKLAAGSYYYAIEANITRPDGTACTVQVLYPKFFTVSTPSYKVTFDSQGGTVSPNTMTVVNGGFYGLLPTPSRTGYTFEGWYANPNCSGERIETGDGLVLFSNHTLYAKWQPRGAVVSFDSCAEVPINDTLAVSYGQPYGDIPIPPYCEGLYFQGWFTAEQGGEMVDDSTIFALERDQTLYAHWTDEPIQGNYGYSQYVYFPFVTTWEKAQAIAEQYGGHLVKIETKEESDFLLDLLEDISHPYYWIGARSTDQGSSWQWTDGTDVDFKNWASDQPNGNSGETYAVCESASGFWYDTPAFSSKTGFVVEIPAEIPVTLTALKETTENGYLITITANDLEQDAVIISAQYGKAGNFCGASFFPVSLGQAEIQINMSVEDAARVKFMLVDSLDTFAPLASAKTIVLDETLWSEWSDSLPDNVDDFEIETLTKYRYREIERTTSNNADMEGWELENTTYNYGEWGAKQTTTTRPTESDTLRITATSTQYNYQHWHSYYDNTWCIDSINYGSSGFQHTMQTPSRLTSVYNMGDMGGKTCYLSSSICCANNYYIWFENGSTTTYTYQMREMVPVYHFLRHSEWSDWQNDPIEENELTDVESQILYRWRLKG